MLAVLHYNENIEAENRRKRVVRRRSARIEKANNLPNPRIHKTPYFRWQSDIMKYIYLKPQTYVIDKDMNELADEMPDELMDGLDRFYIDDEADENNVEPLWPNFFDEFIDEL